MKPDIRTATAVFEALPEIEGDAPPEWVPLIPAPAGADMRVTTAENDGRWWTLEPDAVVAATRIRPAGLCVDWEHATQKLAPQGFRAPASGWIKAVESRDGGIVARIDWTRRGAESLTEKEYRYISATFRFDYRTRRILSVVGAGLTNDPAFDQLPALARREDEEVSEMDEATLKELREALGLPGNADSAAIVAACRSRGGGPAAPDLSKFVPRADYDTAMTRAGTAERELQKQQDAARDERIKALLDKGVSSGQITPSSRPIHEAACRAEGGIERLEEFLRSAPSLTAPTGASDPDSPPSPGGTADSLTPGEEMVADLMGLTRAEMATEGRAAA